MIIMLDPFLYTVGSNIVAPLAAALEEDAAPPKEDAAPLAGGGCSTTGENGG